MDGNKLYGQPMIDALLELRTKIDRGEILKVSGARLNQTIIKEVGVLVSKILRNASIGNIQDQSLYSVRGFIFPDLEGFTLSTMVNEEWLTPQSVLAVLFAWSATRDIGGMADLRKTS